MPPDKPAEINSPTETSSSIPISELQNQIVESGVELGYRPALDGIRGLLFLVIFTYHSLQFYRIPETTLILFIGGFMSVDGFFVLSGFLITALLVDEWERTGKISLKKFYLRRILRLLPALYLLLLACLIFVLFFANAHDRRLLTAGMLAAFFYCANIVATMGTDIGALLHTWSLSLEEQFYLVWPITLTVLLRRRSSRRLILAIPTICILLVVVWRAWLWHQGTGIGRSLYAPDTRADTLFVGCLLGLLWSWRMLPNSPRARVAGRFLSIIAVLFLIYRFLHTHSVEAYPYQGGFTLVAIAFAVLIWTMLEFPFRTYQLALENPVFVWLGRCSYSLYLWHVPVIFLVGLNVKTWGAKPALIAFPICVAVAATSFYGIEQPFLRLKRKFAR